jgi:hypothetical protein
MLADFADQIEPVSMMVNSRHARRFPRHGRFPKHGATIGQKTLPALWGVHPIYNSGGPFARESLSTKR